MGIRGGFLKQDPWVLLMPRMTLYKRLNGVKSGSQPSISDVNLMAAIWALIFLCECVGHKYVANKIRVF